MKISDELRKWINTVKWLDDKMSSSHKNILAIADRIDAEYQKVLDERFNALMDARDDGVNAVLKGPEGFGLIALPKDADDVRWNIGDKDENGNEVIAFKLASDGWYVITDNKWSFQSEKYRHYHAPTIEDVLREFGDWYAHTKGGCDEDSIIAEYAAKLQLKEN